MKRPAAEEPPRGPHETPSGPKRAPRRRNGASRRRALSRRGGTTAPDEALARRVVEEGRGRERSFAGQHTSDVVGALGDLDEAHASAASRDGAGGDVDGEDAAQEPGPRMPGGRRGGRGERGEVGGGEERELRRRLRLAAEDDLGAHGRVRGEDAVITEHVTSWIVRIASDANVRRRDEGAEPRDEVEGVEQDGVGAVFPRSLEGEADAPVGVELEAALVERRSRVA